MERKEVLESRETVIGIHTWMELDFETCLTNKAGSIWI